MDAFAYLFRFCCDPLHNAEEEIKSLCEFAPAMLADDVMIFCNVQELNTGHTTKTEQDLYIRLIRDVRKALPDSISISINPWHSLMHMDQGKRLKPGQDFRLMRDVNGLEATLSVCPACENWRTYIAELYERYAKTQPFCIWVEDDFRFHNHAPLSWGGCFCEEHMRRFSQAAGKDLSIDEFISDLLEPGRPHPYRKVWLDSCRRDLLEAARTIGQAVRSVSEDIRTGLMSSLPQVHAAEGRDWHGILRNLSGKNPPVSRPHLPAYSEIAPSRYMLAFNQITMLNRAFLPEDTEIYPELENFPYSLYTKSLRFTRFQLLSSLPLSLHGMTIDLFDLNGSGINRTEKWEFMLSELKPLLNALQTRRVFRAQKIGVKLLVSPDSSYTLHTFEGKSMEELYPQETLFAGLMGAFGISFCYCTDAKVKGEILACGGQVLRNFSQQQILSLFEHNFVLLDGEAAATLYDLGLGKLAGLASCRWVRQDSGMVSYEQSEDGRIYGGIKKARASAIVSCCDILHIDYIMRKKVEPLSGFYDFYGERRADAQVIWNKKVYIFPFGHLQDPTYIPPMLLNSFRAKLLSDYLPDCTKVPRVIDKAYLSLYAYRGETGCSLYLVNAATDPSEGLRIRLGERAIKSISAIASERGPQPFAPPFRQEGDSVRLDLTIPSMETLLLDIEFMM